jgi:hypothetical protein
MAAAEQHKASQLCFGAVDKPLFGLLKMPGRHAV